MNEPTVWFCPDCGTIRDLQIKCCPDWIRAREVTKNFALTCQETFKRGLDYGKYAEKIIEDQAKQIEALQSKLSAIEALEYVGEVETIKLGFGDTEKLSWSINWTSGHILPHGEKLYANAKAAQSNTLEGIMHNSFID